MTLKLGPDTHTARSSEQDQAQRYFLDAVSQVTPEVLNSLASDRNVRKLHKHVTADPPTDATGTMEGIVIHWFQLETQKEGLKYAKRRALAFEMRNWASSFNLDYPWVLNEALNTLWLWHTKVIDTKARKTWKFHTRYSGIAYNDWDITFTFTHLHDAGDYCSLNRDALYTKAFDAFKEAFEASYNCMLTDRYGLNWKITGSKESDLHFRWLALAVVRGLDAGTIAEMFATEDENGFIKLPDRTTVSKAVADVAELVGIPSPLARGRPKKQRGT